MNHAKQFEHYPLMQLIEELDENSRCRYPSKRCENPRVVKRNDELHRFCEHHRVVANHNQQRLQQRRRVQMGRMSNENDLAAMQQMYSDYTAQQQQDQYYPQCADTLLDLSEEDLCVLEAMLLDDDDMDFAQDDCLFGSPQGL